MFQQGEFEQANHFSGITALVDAALTSHDDPAAEIAPLEAPGAPAQHPVQQIAQIDASSGAQIVPIITAPTAEWPVYADLDADRLAEARRFCPTYKPNNIKLTGYKPPKSKPRMCELWQVVMERDATQRPKNWTLVKMVSWLLEHDPIPHVDIDAPGSAPAAVQHSPGFPPPSDRPE